MLLPRLSLLLAAATVTFALDGASPFFLVCSDALSPNATLRSLNIATAPDVEDHLIETLADCSASRYTIFSQCGVSAEDFQGKNGFPRTRQRLSEAKSGAVVDIPNVGILGELSGETVVDRVSQACMVRGKRIVQSDDSRTENAVVVEHITLNTLTTDRERAKAVAEADSTLDKRIKDVINTPANDRSVLIYITSPVARIASEMRPYEMDESLGEMTMHTDLRRDVYTRQEGSSDEGQVGLPLFETYQFFTPGLFMGLGVSILLLMILYVGISAIAGLNVSYAAFNKEMGPQAQKKLQ